MAGPVEPVQRLGLEVVRLDAAAPAHVDGGEDRAALAELDRDGRGVGARRVDEVRERDDATVAQGRMPALTPYWESIGAPGVFFAGNVTQAATGLRRHANVGSSAAVHGFRYNARVLAERLAATLGGTVPERRRLAADEVVPFLLGEATRAPELWAQKGYLARVVLLAVARAAVAVELSGGGEIFPGVYLRRGGRVDAHDLPGDALNRFDGDEHRRALAALLA